MNIIHRDILKYRISGESPSRDVFLEGKNQVIRNYMKVVKSELVPIKIWHVFFVS